MPRFDVFGRVVRITRRDGGWHAAYVGPDGKLGPAHDVRVPDALAEEELARYLTDLFHESATPERPAAIELPE